MTRDEIKKELDILKTIVPESMKNIIQVIEGVLRLPCRKDAVANGDGKGHADEWSIGWNECLAEVKKALNITEGK